LPSQLLETSLIFVAKLKATPGLDTVGQILTEYLFDPSQV